MKKWLRPWSGTALVLAILVLVFYSWYNGNDPVTEAEIDQFLEYVETLDETSKNFIHQSNVRQFLGEDDGKAFYVVNLFEFKDPSGASSLNEYSQRVIPLWLRHGAHPIFSSTTVLNASQWERITIVRYRSRRDWINIVSDPDFIAALPLRFEATGNNLRLTIEGISIPAPMLLLLLLVFIIGMGVYLLEKMIAKRAPAETGANLT